MSARSRALRRCGAAAAAAVALLALTGIAGCAPTERSTVSKDVSTSIEAADPDLTGVAVERSRDGLASVLSVSVAIDDESIDATRLSTLLSATVSAPGASRFDQLHFAVWTPDLDGELVDLRSPADELGLTAPDSTIVDDIADVRKAVR